MRNQKLRNAPKMKVNGPPCRQGDIYFQLVPEDAVPEEAERCDVVNGRLLVEEGELTGHFHAVPYKEGIEMMALGDEKYITAPEGMVVQHEEHDPIKFPAPPKGMRYKAWRQKAYTPERWNNVAD